MTRLLLVVLVAFLVHVDGAKIYNALISSDENLTPSHAYPVVEPVLRTTALGVAFPPLIVHPPAKTVENKVSNSIQIVNDPSYDDIKCRRTMAMTRNNRNWPTMAHFIR